MAELQLPCPPLDEWVLDSFEAGPVGLFESVSPSRAMRGVLDGWSRLSTVEVMAEVPAAARQQLAGVVVVGDVRQPPTMPEALRVQLRPGALVVELVDVRAGLVAELLALERPKIRQAERAARRAIGWSQLGLCQLEQWMSSDPPDLVVTLGRAFMPG